MAVHDFLIQQNQQCIVVINTDFTIGAVNAAYLKTVGKKRDEVIGAHCYQLIHGLDAPCDTLRNGMVCPMLETLRTGRSAKGIHSMATAEKASAFHDIVTYPVRNEKGQTIRVIEIWMDLERKISSRWEKRERELKSDLNKLIQEDRLISLGKLVASCVHEINNPIQGLLTFSHLMKKMLATDRLTDAEIAEMREFSGIMADELERCGKIISGLLSFSRESHNAFKDIEAMGPGGWLEIVSTGMTESRIAQVEIRDTGHGIPQKHLDHIYDPFFTTKAMGEGTGMGLSIVYGIVKSHQGKIRVLSEVGKGTTFSIQLPLAPTTGEQ